MPTSKQERVGRFSQRFPHNIAEVIDDFGSTVKSDLLAFMEDEIAKAETEAYMKGYTDGALRKDSDPNFIH